MVPSPSAKVEWAPRDKRRRSEDGPDKGSKGEGPGQPGCSGSESATIPTQWPGPQAPVTPLERDHMHQLIAILAAAFGFLTGGHALQPQDATPPIGMGAPVRPADASPPIGLPGPVKPSDASPPIGM